MKFYPPIKMITFSVAIVAWAALPFSASFLGEPTGADAVVMQCPSGHAEARLTGWRLNNQTPVGTAEFNEATKTLTVSVESVGLPDGRVLFILAGDDRIGTMSPLKDGKATGTATRAIPDGARIRVFDEDRPIVSANLRCAQPPVATPAIAPTVSPALPSPTPTPTPGTTATPTPTPSPTPTVSPSPSGEPTPDPMPKQSPAPSPSPTL